MGTAQTASPRAARASRDSPETRATARPARWQSTWALAIAGNVLLWAALPPLSLSLLAWLAPVPWILLVRQTQLHGRRPYTVVWASSVAFWLAMLYWLTLPHWATSIGWVALACYLGLYLPLFVGLTRVAVHKFRISPVLAAPVVWTGLELARAHLLSGFPMASLSHALYRWPVLLQVSDVLGSYGVSFLIVLVAAGIARMVPLPGSPQRAAWRPIVPVAAALTAALVYGNWRTGEQSSRPGPRVALIQGSIDIDIKHDPTQAQRIFEEYFDLSLRAVRDHPDLDLIVWPETMFRYPWFTFEEGYIPPPDTITPEEATSRSRRAVRNTVRPLETNVLLGIDSVLGTAHGGKPLRYNTALFLDPTGEVIGRYDKCHPVMFGEYIPLGSVFPWIYDLTPLATGLESGAGPVAVSVGGTRYAANICYEDSLPHLVRRHVAQLRNQGDEPDVLVNLTNDGWFYGSSELDIHLASALFRAIECRKPLLIAANTGFSAWIDANGRIRAQGPRRATDVIVADVELDDRISWYSQYGDVFAGLCLLATVGLAVAGTAGVWSRRRDDYPSTAAA